MASLCTLKLLIFHSVNGPIMNFSIRRGEKVGEGLVSLLRHGPEMVDSVST